MRIIHAIGAVLVFEGELRCVIGPNGAGKTMMDVITGKTKPDPGRVILGKDLDLLRLDEPKIASAGVGREFQKPTVFERHPVWKISSWQRLTSASGIDVCTRS